MNSFLAEQNDDNSNKTNIYMGQLFKLIIFFQQMQIQSVENGISNLDWSLIESQKLWHNPRASMKSLGIYLKKTPKVGDRKRH